MELINPPFIDLNRSYTDNGQIEVYPAGFNAKANRLTVGSNSFQAIIFTRIDLPYLRLSDQVLDLGRRQYLQTPDRYF